jgi:hypothetical protein
MGRSKASRKRYAKKHHNHNEIAGRLVRRRKIKEKQIISTVKAGCSRRTTLRRVKAQIDCHNTFDRLWQEPSPTMTRWKAYEYLLEIIGVRHISYLNKLQCRIVAERVKRDFPQLFGTRCNKRGRTYAS